MSLLITGMHRSGTSLLAQWVAATGLTMGEGPAFETDSANPRGLYERRDVVAFNDRWLRALGGSWEAPPRIDDDTWRRLDAGELERDRTQLDVFAADGPAWFVKDPRLCLLLPLWDRLCLRRLPLLVAVRQPREVAMSLNVRNGMTLRKGLALWAAYNRAVFKHVAERNVLILEVGRTLADPAAAGVCLADYVRSCGFAVDPDQRLGTDVEPKLMRQTAPSLPGYAERLAVDLDPMFEALRDHHGCPTRTLANPVEIPDWAEEALAELSAEWALRQQLDAAAAALPGTSRLERLMRRGRA